MDAYEIVLFCSLHTLMREFSLEIKHNKRLIITTKINDYLNLGVIYFWNFCLLFQTTAVGG